MSKKKISEAQILRLKQEVEKTERRLHELVGREKELTKRLKEQWGCDTIEQAREILDDLLRQIDELERDLEQGVREVEGLLNEGCEDSD